jgi:hypothetical protein
MVNKAQASVRLYAGISQPAGQLKWERKNLETSAKNLPKELARSTKKCIKET